MGPVSFSSGLQINWNPTLLTGCFPPLSSTRVPYTHLGALQAAPLKL